MTKDKKTKYQKKNRIIPIKKTYKNIDLDDHDWVKLGLKLINENRMNDAIRSFDWAINQNPYNSEAFYHKGKCLIKQGKGDLGIECFEKAMEIREITKYMDEVDELTIINNHNNKQGHIESDSEDYGSEKVIKEFIKSNPKQVLKILKKELNYESHDYRKNLEKIATEKRRTQHKKEKHYKDSCDNYVNQFFTHKDKINNKELNSFEIENNFKLLKTKLNESHKIPDKKGSVMTEIMPQEGGIKKRGKSLLNQFIEYQRSQIKLNVDYLISNHGGGANYYVEPKYLFRIGILLLEILVEEYFMDGIIIAIDKPAIYIQKILKKTLKSKYEPSYIDCNTFEPSNLKFGTNQFFTRTLNDEQKQNYHITYLSDNFNFQELRDSIEIHFQKVVEYYEGEHHFVFIDNVSAFRHYTTEQQTKKFIGKLTTDLQKFNLFGFFMVPKKTINISFFDTLQNLPEAISNKFNFWNK